MTSRRNFVKNASLVGAGITLAPQFTFASNTKNSQKLKVGLIGVGLRGTNHLNNVLLRDDVLVTAICDIDPNRIAIALHEIEKSGEKIIIDRSVLKYRPCSAAAIVKGIKLTDELIKEIMQNQEKLHISYGRNRKKVALGYYILDKISFPVTYKALEPKKLKFQPLHFDKELNGLQILSQHPTGREFGYQLEGLDKFHVVDHGCDVFVVVFVPGSYRGCQGVKEHQCGRASPFGHFLDLIDDLSGTFPGI